MNNHSSLDNHDSQVLLNKIVIEYMREQKRKRIGRWIFRMLFFVVILWGVYQAFSLHSQDVFERTQEHVGLIDLKGTIFENQMANSDDFMKSLTEAYESENMKALILRIDSPGGSPVQADYMYSALNHFKKKHPDVKTYAVCVDACASAAYYVAAATDEIYANPSSLVGSIGVLYNGFGFVDAIEKLGVSRRLYTAGRFKGFMDPFSPPLPQAPEKLQTMLDLIHQRFIQKVKEGRGDRLVQDELIFSGLYWTGIQAKERGLIDGFASSGQLAREIIKIDKVIDYTHKDSIVDRVAKSLGTAMIEQLPTTLGMKEGFR